jgi:integrase
VAVGKGPGGKPRFRTCSAVTQADLVRKLAEAKAPGPDTTVASWAARWLTTLGVRPSTKAHYTDTVERHLKPTIGHLRVCDVTASRIEGLAVTLADMGLGTNSVRLALSHARILFGAAVRDGLITANPVAIARKPKAKAKKIDPFTPAELVKVIGACLSVETFAAALMAATGCRVGEAMALDVPDFDPETKTVAITKTFDYEYGTRGPKCRTASVRSGCRTRPCRRCGPRSGAARPARSS